MKIKNLFTKKAAASYLEISILMIAIFAFAFFIAFPEEAKVEAQEGLACCRETQSGLKCQELLLQTCTSCKSPCIPSGCSEVAGCEMGCCINPDGKCMDNSPQDSCIVSGGEWQDKDCRGVNECRTGCCVLGESARALVTEKECDFYSHAAGLEIDFRQGMNEIECIGITMALEKGACVYTIGNERLCKFTTYEDCTQRIHGDFSQRYLCSNPDLNTSCIRQNHKGCVERKDEVYWFDSCGNPENIYSANTDASWNNGMILSKSLSCNPNSNNAGSTSCGNCDHFLGSKCTGANENSICSDLDCYNAPDNNGQIKDRRNGESWCVYDGAIGNGQSLVGSRHWKYSCVEGEVRIDPCADFRNEICVQEEVQSNAGGSFSNANCRINRWQSCIEGSGCKEDGGDCFPITLKLSANLPQFNVCLPRYAPGFDIKDGGRGADAICQQATYGCNVIYERQLFRGWTCVYNCECEAPSFTQQMHDWCSSLGDCGFKKNIVGKATKNYYVTGAPASAGSVGSLSWNNHYPKLSDIEDFIEGIDAAQIPEGGNYAPNISERINKAAGMISGAGGTIGMVGGLLNWVSSGAGSIGTIGTVISGFGSTIFAIGAGAFAGKIIGDIFGLQGQALSATAASGAISGGIAAVSTASAASIGTGGAITAGSALAAGSSLGLGSGLASGALSGGSAIASGTITSGSVVVGGSTMVVPAGGTIAVSTGTTATGVVTTTTITTTATGVTTTSTVTGVAGATVSTGTTATIGSGGVVVGEGGATLATAGTAGTGATAGSSGAVLATTFTTIITIAVVIIIAVVITAIIMKLLGIGETKQSTVTFRCQAWQPPAGGADCEKCNADPLKPCSKYRCQSLGRACKLINEGTTEEKCISSPDDLKAPIISPWQEIITPGYVYTNQTNTGFKIRKQDRSCIESFTPITFGIKTDEVAQCKYDVVHRDKYEDMIGFFGDTNLYLTDHSMPVLLPSVDSIAEQFEIATANVIDKYGNFKLYVKCQDDWGRVSQDYLIDICVSTGPDLTAPLIIKTEPENNRFVSYAQTQQNITVYMNEPAQCKYDVTDRPYKNMGNNMNCKTALIDQTVYGWPCSSTLILEENSTFYIRCKDKPWLPETNTSRIVNQESYQYTLIKSGSELSIDSVMPNRTITAGVEPFAVTLSAKTSGGVNGNADCYYSFTQNESNYIRFFDTGLSYHKQIFDLLTEGEYNVYVKCEDIAGNKAYNSAGFNLNIDDSTPQVIRFFTNNALKIVTDEESECRYSEKTCNFKFENGTKMFGGDFVHEANKISGIYHIKCMDLWGNLPRGCTIKIRIY